MFVIVTSILTVLAWLHLLVFAVYNIGALDGRDRIGFAVNLSAAILCLAIIGIAAYSAIRPRRALVLIPLIALSLLALSLIRGLGSHVSIGFWSHQPVWHSLIDRTA